MSRSARVESSDAAVEEERKAEPAAAAVAREAITGLEDPAISEDALAAAAESRRAHTKRQDDAHDDGRSAFLVRAEGSVFALDDWLARPHVKRELRNTERALSEVENGTGSIEDVNLHYGIMVADFDQMDRFVKAGGRCN